jgi:DNA-binding NarL/FixJ family response regulator
VKPVRVVLAEDSAVLRRALTHFLTEDPGIELVGVADSVQDTLHLLRDTQPHVLLFDLHMAIRHEDRSSDFKAASEKVALVAIAIDDDDLARQLAERCGATCLIDKMEIYDQLVPAILRSVPSTSSDSAA